MKFTWGHGITTFIIGFILFMGFLVYKTMNVQFDLVAEDYYAQELDYQNKLNEMHNVNELEEEVLVNAHIGHVMITLPESQSAAIGNITMYSPANKESDRSFSFDSSTNGNLEISTDGMVPGWYELQLRWEHQETNYYYKQEIEVK